MRESYKPGFKFAELPATGFETDGFGFSGFTFGPVFESPKLLSNTIRAVGNTDARRLVAPQKAIEKIPPVFAFLGSVFRPQSVVIEIGILRKLFLAFRLWAQRWWALRM